MSSVVYWIRHEDHTDVFTQGYIGVSNNTAKRFEEHKNRPSNSHLKHAIKKYGWDNLIKTVLNIFTVREAKKQLDKSILNYDVNSKITSYLL